MILFGRCEVVWARDQGGRGWQRPQVSRDPEVHGCFIQKWARNEVRTRRWRLVVIRLGDFRSVCKGKTPLGTDPIGWGSRHVLGAGSRILRTLCGAALRFCTVADWSSSPCGARWCSGFLTKFKCAGDQRSRSFCAVYCTASQGLHPGRKFTLMDPLGSSCLGYTMQSSSGSSVDNLFRLTHPFGFVSVQVEILGCTGQWSSFNPVSGAFPTWAFFLMANYKAKKSLVRGLPSIGVLFKVS